MTALQGGFSICGLFNDPLRYSGYAVSSYAIVGIQAILRE
jgi:hypothetical protein